MAVIKKTSAIKNQPKHLLGIQSLFLHKVPVLLLRLKILKTLQVNFSQKELENQK